MEEEEMGFRTLEISRPAEVHVRRHQLEVTNDDGTFLIPLEDLSTVICSGANIRMSTMAQSQISEAGISLMIINEKYQPSCIVMPLESNVRQALVLRNQISMTEDVRRDIWLRIITRKIENQSRSLAVLGRDGSEKILRYTNGMNPDNVDACEANAAKEYFSFLHPGLSRRNEDPVNSCLNYGYAVLRNAIIRSIMIAGFQPAIGIHHDNYLNSFNLADDLIEPWRPFVDVIAAEDPGTSLILSRTRRKELAKVLHHACLIDGSKISLLAGIDVMTSSIRNRIVNGDNSPIKLPILLPVEEIDEIKE